MQTNTTQTCHFCHKTKLPATFRVYTTQTTFERACLDCYDTRGQHETRANRAFVQPFNGSGKPVQLQVYDLPTSAVYSIDQVITEIDKIAGIEAQ